VSEQLLFNDAELTDLEKQQIERAKRKAHYLEHRDKFLARAKQYRDSNKDKVRAANRAWYQKNKKKHHEYGKQWAAKHRDYYHGYYKKNKDRMNAENAVYRKKHKQRLLDLDAKNRFRHLIKNGRTRSLRRGMKFDLDQHTDELKARVEKGVCEVTGVALDMLPSKGNNKRRPKIPSIDRINPKLGYTYDNIRIVAWMVNCALGNWTETEEVEEVILAWAEKIKQRRFQKEIPQ
jgi:hypothetical protein